MKIVNKIKDKKRKALKKPKVKAKKEKVLIVAQEIKFARLLAGNDKKTRDRVLKTFKKWLLNCFVKGYEFKEEDFIRVWKGLFYAMWMSDKPLVQEELCETIAGILDLFPSEQLHCALMMTKAGFQVLATEWYGIDHHRMDKFHMLVRRYLRGSLRCLRRCDWNLQSCQMYAQMLAGKEGLFALKTPLYARNAGSMLLHVVDCFLEELAKVSLGKLPAAAMPELLRPFCAYMCGGEVPALCMASRRLLTALLRQSDQGLEYHHKTKEWEMMGCPAGGPDALELVSDDEADDDSATEDADDDDDDDGGSQPLDPRAGRVDVVLRPLPAAAGPMAALLRELLATATSKAYKRTKICLERFEQLAADSYPLVVQGFPDDDDESAAPPPRAVDAAKELSALEKTLVKSADELALRGLSRKHRKRLLAKSRTGASIVDDVAPIRADAATNGNWEVVSTLPPGDEAKKQQTDSSNKENLHRDKKSKKRKHPDTSADRHSKKQKADIPQTQADDKATKKSYEKQTKSPENKKSKKQIHNVKKERKSPNLSPRSAQTLSATKERTETVLKQTPSNNNKVVAKKSYEKQTKSPENKTKSKKQLNNLKQEKRIPNLPQSVLQKSPIPKEKTEIVLKQTPSNETRKKVKNISSVTPSEYQKKTSDKKTGHQKKVSYDTPKKVKFVLKNNSMQKPVDYYKSVRQSPSIPFDSSKLPSKTNLKVSTPSPINPFFKKKLRLK